MSRLRNLNNLIRIEDAIKILCCKTCHPGVFCPDIYCKEMWDEFEDVERVEVKRKGQWITNKYNQIVCSECAVPALEVETGCLVNRHLEPYKTHFCPNCGADMRKDSE